LTHGATLEPAYYKYRIGYFNNSRIYSYENIYHICCPKVAGRPIVPNAVSGPVGWTRLKSVQAQPQPMGRVLGGEEAGGDVGDELVLGRTVHRGNLGAILLANGGALGQYWLYKKSSTHTVKANLEESAASADGKCLVGVIAKNAPIRAARAHRAAKIAAQISREVCVALLLQ
jgi:hypothetical protein